MKTRVFALIMTCCCMLGCAGFWDSTSSSGSGTTKHVLYVVNNNDGGTGGVVPFSIKSSGKLSKISNEVAAGSGPNSIAITPDNTYLYVGNTDGGISAYGIASDGSLSALTGSPFATSLTPVSLAVDSGGNYLYALDTTSSAISVYRVSSSTGALSSLQTVFFSSVANVSGPLNAVRAAPHKKYLYVALGVDGIWVYKIGTGGTLTFVTSIKAPSGGQAMDVALEPNGTNAYIPDGVSAISAYSVDQSGGLTVLAGSPFAAGTSPVSAAVDPSGQYVYAVNQDANSLSAFARNSDGTLTALSGQPGTGLMPASVTIDSSGKFVYVTNKNDSPDVSIYQIQSDGTLASIGSASSGAAPIASVVTHY
jgi:6-phosphogluconolactonase